MTHGWQQGIGQGLYSIRLDGTNLRHITEEPPRAHQEGPGDIEPTISPDGRWIAFARGGINGFQIAIVNRHGGGLTLITPPELLAEQPRWSADGHTIAFRASIDGTFNVMSVGVDGTGLRQLTFDTPDTGRSVQPVYAPDGTQILFVHQDEDGRDLYLMNPDGSAIHRLAATPDELEFSPDWRATP
jgi:Tol biopolymer transport system component